MGERGSAPIEFAAGVLLLLVPVVALVLSFAPALERRVLARSLAADIAHAFAVGAPGEGDREAWLNRAWGTGVEPESVRVEVCGSAEVPLDRIGSCPDLEVVNVTVTVSVGGIVDEVRHSHRMPVPIYRSRS